MNALSGTRRVVCSSWSRPRPRLSANLRSERSGALRGCRTTRASASHCSRERRALARREALIMRGGRPVGLVDAAAGTGKATLLGELASVHRGQGYDVVGLAKDRAGAAPRATGSAHRRAHRARKRPRPRPPKASSAPAQPGTSRGRGRAGCWTGLSIACGRSAPVRRSSCCGSEVDSCCARTIASPGL